jgi:hypothetical protein
VSTRTEVQAQLDRVTFREPLASLRPRLRVAEGCVSRPRVRCELVLSIPDSADGVSRDFVTAFGVDTREPVARWVEAIKGALLDRARHELGESLMLDGVLVNDPHAQPTRRRP